MAAGRTLQHLREAEAVADSSSSKFTEQTRQLERLTADMERINGNLDTTNKSVSNMEKSFAESLMTKGVTKGMTSMTKGMKGMWGSATGAAPEPQAVKALDAGGPPVMSGWLSKRGPMMGYKWQRRWIVLCPRSLTWYTDPTSGDKRGEASISALSKAHSFQHSAAPGDALKHRGEKPSGFVLDPDGPEAGPQRRLFYFEAPDEAALRSWLQAVQRAAQSQQAPSFAPSARGRAAGGGSGGGQTAEDLMVEINAVAGNLNDHAQNIKAEVKQQTALIGQFNDRADCAQAKIDDQTRRARKLGGPAQAGAPSVSPAQAASAMALAGSPAKQAQAAAAMAVAGIR